MCITKYFKTPDQIKSDICGSESEHQLSKMMSNETEIEKYSKFMEERNQKIDLWHRQFENMTIEETGILETFSEFEILKLQDNQKPPKKNDARFNMIFADAAVEKLINDYKGRFSMGHRLWLFLPLILEMSHLFSYWVIKRVILCVDRYCGR